MDILSVVTWVFRTFPFLRRWRWVRVIVTKVAVWEATRRVPSRPYPFCMTPRYTTWPGLTDRRITGRHLGGPADDRYRLPDPKDVASIFLRPEGKEKPCSQSSLLFAAFAQWFTDSFLRTSHGFEYDSDGNAIRDSKDNLIRKPGREAFNDSNHEIDLCQIYGIDEARTTFLRVRKPSHHERGFLAYELHSGQAYPRRLIVEPRPSRTKLAIVPELEELHDEPLLRVIFDKVKESRITDMFAVGLEHGNVTLGNSLFNTLFLREHNRVAGLIGAAHPDWVDDQVFQTTRNVLMVMLLKIVIKDYITHLSPGNMPFELLPRYSDSQRWYRGNRISIEFNLLYRWHELVPEKFSFLDDLEDYKHNNGWLLQHGPEALIEALSKQRAGQITLGNTPRWLESVLVDTIKLMRDSRLASYSDYRERFFGRKGRPKSFADVTKDPERRKALERLYPDGIESLEWFVGMYAEDVAPGTVTGGLMRAMVGYDAFTHALTNPLLANGVYGENTFSKVGLEQLGKTNGLCDLVRRNVSKPEIFCSFRAPA